MADHEEKQPLLPIQEDEGEDVAMRNLVNNHLIAARTQRRRYWAAMIAISILVLIQIPGIIFNIFQMAKPHDIVDAVLDSVPLIGMFHKDDVCICMDSTN